MSVSQADIDALMSQTAAGETAGAVVHAGVQAGGMTSDRAATARQEPRPPEPRPPESRPPESRPPELRPPELRLSAAPGMGRGANDLGRILHLPVPIKVELASRTMPVSSILRLTVGSIIDFQKSFDSELSLFAGNRCIGMGRAVKIGENFGLRITRIGSVASRIEALRV